MAPCLALVLGPLLAGAPLEPRSAELDGSAGDSSVEAPGAAPRPVRVSHRHLRVKACTAEAEGERRVCKAELTEADSAGTLHFWLDAAPSSLDDEQRRASVTFPHHVGQQERMIELAVGRWRVTWEEAGLVRRVPVRDASLPVVELTTTSGRCERYRDTCRLVPATVTRRITVTDEAKTELSSRL